MPIEWSNRRGGRPGSRANPDPSGDPYTLPIDETADTSGPTEPTTPGPGAGDAGTGGGGYNVPPYTGPLSPDYNWEAVPAFVAPRFRAPTAEDVYADPSYQFRLGQGEQALQQSAAGRGMLRTGATLKDILEYGQNFASQEYSNVYDRSLQAYDRLYRGALDEYNPNLIEWQTKMAGMQRAADLGWERAWDNYVFGQTHEWDVNNSILNWSQGG